MVKKFFPAMPLLEVKIPPMGESITSGVLAKWHVKDGDTVKKDQPLFELETDKITSEGTAEAAGKISLKAAAGDEVKIGQVVATIDPASADAGSNAASGAPTAAIGNPYAPPASQQAAEAVEQSPAVRRLAAETGINPASVAGSGKAGRVTKGDMLAAADTAAAGGKGQVQGTSEKNPAKAPASLATPTAQPSARLTETVIQIVESTKLASQPCLALCLARSAGRKRPWGIAHKNPVL